MQRHKIFISYRREDSAGSAGRLYDKLEGLFGKGAVFRDIDKIPWGENFQSFLEKKLVECEVVLVIIGKSFFLQKNDEGNFKLHSETDFVNIELALALAHRKKVIPILVDNAKFSSNSNFPDNLKDIAKLNAFEIRHERWEDDVSILANSLRAILKKTPGEQRENENSEDNIIVLLDIFLLLATLFYTLSVSYNTYYLLNTSFNITRLNLSEWQAENILREFFLWVFFIYSLVRTIVYYFKGQLSLKRIPIYTLLVAAIGLFVYTFFSDEG